MERHGTVVRIGALLLAAAVLLLPALLIGGRPLIYWDTPTFYGWGRDIIEAVKNPWPPLSDFPAHRGLWAADNYPGAWDRITSQQFQLLLTSIGARSSFYAVPFYALGSTFTLWAPAAVQALIAAWLLWVATSVVLGGAQVFAYARLIAVLTVATAAPLFVAFLMPDVFAAFALLATALLLCFPDRLTGPQRVGCAALVAVSVLFHMSILPAIAVLLLVGLGATRFFAPFVPAGRGALVTVAALACAGALAFAGGAGLKAIFGQEVRSPPFVQGRVIVDGPGQQFLRETCAERGWAACLWKDSQLFGYTDDIIWPDVTWNNLPLITDPAERRRYLDETPAVVLGTLLHHPFAQLRASARNALEQLARFNVAHDVGGALYGLMNVNTDRTMRIVQTVPNIGPCLVGDARACDHRPVFKVLQLVHYATVAAALVVLGVCILRWTKLRRGFAAGAPDDGRRLAAFAITIVGGVVLNAIVCGAFSGPYGRYQARVVWLVPMAGMLLLERARRESGWRGLQWRTAATAPAEAGKGA